MVFDSTVVFSSEISQSYRKCMNLKASSSIILGIYSKKTQFEAKMVINIIWLISQEGYFVVQRLSTK